MFGILRKPDRIYQETASEEDGVSLLPSPQAWRRSSFSGASLTLWLLVAIALAQTGVLGVRLWQWKTADETIPPTNSLLAASDSQDVMFSPHPAFYNLKTSQHVSVAWMIYNLPGLVEVSSPDRQDYKGPKARFAVSVFHQLHCLEALEKSIIHMASEASPQSPSTAHAYHCFDYLRHSFMCAGDMTLESIGKPPSGPGNPSWAGAKHTCRNWQDVVSWQEQHYSPMV